MAAVVYRCDFKGELGTQYRVDIWDAESTAETPATFRTEAPGFSLEYQGAGEDDITAHVIGSTVNISFLVENSTQATFVDTLIKAEYQRFHIKVYRATELFWLGFLDYSGQEIQDDYYPYVFQICATDLIGSLSQRYASLIVTPVNTTDPLNFGRLTLLTYFKDLISLTAFSELVPSGDTLLEFITQWWCYDIMETVAPQPASPEVDFFFQNIAFHPYAVNFQHMNALEALEMLLKLFNLRLFQSKGCFIIEHMYRKTKTTYYVWDVSNDATPTLTCVEGVKYKTESTDYTKLAGSVYYFSKPMRRAIMKYYDDIFNSSGIIQTSEFDTIAEIGSPSESVANRDQIDIGSVTVGTHSQYVSGGTTYYGAGTLWTRGRTVLQPSILAQDFWCDSANYHLPAVRHAKALLTDYLFMRKSFLKILSGAIQSADFAAHKTLIFADTTQYHFLRGSFTASDEVWQGEWVKLSGDYTDIDFTSTETYTDK